MMIIAMNENLRCAVAEVTYRLACVLRAAQQHTVSALWCLKC
jgi:hypothetical protein